MSSNPSSPCFCWCFSFFMIQGIQISDMSQFTDIFAVLVCIKSNGIDSVWGVGVGGYGWYFLITTYQYFFAMPPPFHTSPINDISTFMSHTRHIHKIVNLWWWRRWKPSCVRHKLDLQGTTIFPTEDILKVFPSTTFDRHPRNPQGKRQFYALSMAIGRVSPKNVKRE